jgi:hypothetical protein
MTNKLHIAVDCFNENLRLFSNPQLEPEKYNLYTGLASIAEGIMQLSIQVDSLQNEVQSLRSQLGK